VEYAGALIEDVLNLQYSNAEGGCHATAYYVAGLWPSADGRLPSRIHWSRALHQLRRRASWGPVLRVCVERYDLRVWDSKVRAVADFADTVLSCQLLRYNLTFN
jgi:hypothetical protein